MPTKTEIIEAGVRAMGADWSLVRDPIMTAIFRDLTGVALTAMLPLILEAVADKARAQKRGINDWNDDVREQVAQLIERFEL